MQNRPTAHQSRHAGLHERTDPPGLAPDSARLLAQDELENLIARAESQDPEATDILRAHLGGAFRQRLVNALAQDDATKRDFDEIEESLRYEQGTYPEDLLAQGVAFAHAMHQLACERAFQAEESNSRMRHLNARNLCVSFERIFKLHASVQDRRRKAERHDQVSQISSLRAQLLQEQLNQLKESGSARMHRASQRTPPSLKPQGYREPPPSPDANPRHYGYETFEEYVADLDPPQRKRLLRDMAKHDAMRASWGHTAQLYQDRFPTLFEEDGQPKEDDEPNSPHPGPRTSLSAVQNEPSTPKTDVYYENGKTRKPYDYNPHPEPKGDPSPGLPAGYIAYKTGTYYDAEVNPIPPRRPQGPIDSFTQNLLREALHEVKGDQNTKPARS